MRPVTKLIRVKHGSNLYGTNTPTSDLDFKGVHLPSGEAIILQRAENVIDTSVVAKAEGTDKNTSDAIDSQSYSVQKFYEMLMKGDTVATEILFAPLPDGRIDDGPLCFYTEEWLKVREIGLQLLNRQCKGFVGYCVRQAAKYGIKGSRMNAVRGVLDELSKLGLGRTTSTTKLSVIEPQLRRWAEGREHVKWENIPNPNGSDNWHLDVCDRKVSMNLTINAAYDIWNKVWDNYGERARQAMTNEGIDWKAMSHAVRVAGQAIELLNTGKISFPRPDAAFLLSIKQGRVGYEVVSPYLEDLVEQVRVASEQSKLPEKSDHKLADRSVLQLYRSQIDGNV
jgi:hypothetical protein